MNSCCPARDAPILASGSDDSCARIWDVRVRTTQRTLKHPFAVTSAVLSASAHSLYTGCLDGVVRIFDLRRPDVEQTKLEGHQDIVTGMALSPDGGHLLSNSMDNTVRCWDVRPFCDGDRCTKVYLGAQHNYEKTLIKCARRHVDAPAPPPRPPLLIPNPRCAARRCAWSKDGQRVGAGSADTFVYVWDASSRRIVYKLPGHSGSINEVDFHPNQPIIASCANDKQIYLGEIKGL